MDITDAKDAHSIVARGILDAKQSRSLEGGAIEAGILWSQRLPIDPARLRTQLGQE